jgi:hypothetical protein
MARIFVGYKWRTEIWAIGITRTPLFNVMTMPSYAIHTVTTDVEIFLCFQAAQRIWLKDPQRRGNRIAGIAKSLRHKSNLEKYFAAAVYLSEALALLNFVLR